MARGTQCLNLLPEFGYPCTCPGGEGGYEGGKFFPQRRIKTNRRSPHSPRDVACCFVDQVCLKNQSLETLPVLPGVLASRAISTDVSRNLHVPSNQPPLQGKEQLVPPKPLAMGEEAKRAKVSIGTEQISLKASSETST